MTTWMLNPPWSLRVVALVGACLLALAVFRTWRERRGGLLLVLRLGVIAVLLGVFCNPQSLFRQEQTGRPKLIILVDSSASMATADVEGGPRLSKAVTQLRQSLGPLEQAFEVDLRRFDEMIRPGDLAELDLEVGLGDASDLGMALMSAVGELSSVPAQAGVLVVSDGRSTTAGTLEAAQLALAHSVPLWTWCLGGPVARRDVWIETASSEALAFSGSEVELTATLRADGYPNQSFDVQLVSDEEVIATEHVLPGSNGAARVSLRVQAPPAGEKRYAFRVAAQGGEVDTLNNERAIFLRSVGDRVRVFLAEGQPHWDTKFLVQSLQRDAHVDLTAVYRLNAERHVGLISSTGGETRVDRDLFPRTAADLERFDVVILGRSADAFFDANTEGLLTDFVARRGGSLVFGRGKPYGGRFPALAKLEPVAWGAGARTDLRLAPTEAGRNTPIFDLGAAGNLDELLERLPALDQASVTLGEKPLAIVLASALEDEGPVLVAYQRYGQGKVISLNASGLWRWAFREVGQEESEIAYRRFWISLLQWLLHGSQFLPGNDVALTSARRYYTSDQPMQFLVHTRNLDPAVYQPKLAVTGPSGTVEVEPRPRGESFVAEAGPFEPGTYRVVLRNNVGSPPELAQSVEVVTSSVETREFSADPELMGSLAVQSGGNALQAEDIARLPEIVRRWQASRELAHRQHALWDRWWLLALLLVVLGSEWWLRRGRGLL